MYICTYILFFFLFKISRVNINVHLFSILQNACTVCNTTVESFQSLNGMSFLKRKSYVHACAKMAAPVVIK